MPAQEMPSQLEAAFAMWPKVELHRHLEGTVRLETAWEWAQCSPTLAFASLDALREAIQFDGTCNFAHFLSKFNTLRQLYHDQGAVEQVAREAVADAAADNVRYLELRFSPDHFARHAGFDPFQTTELLLKAANEEARQQGITVRFLCTIGRAYNTATANRIIEIALAFLDHGIVGIDLAGDELQDPAPPFQDLIERAATEGLGISIHAGEAGPSAAVWDAVRIFHADRIAHGIRSVDDPELLETLCEQEIALEVCPTSNLQTGAVRSLEEHPLPELLRAGVPVALSTDDPAISGITLTDEYGLAVEHLGLTPAQLAHTILTAARHAFLPEAEKRVLTQELEEKLGAMGVLRK